MADCNHSIPDPSCDVCGLAPLARNHYFDGKWMATHQFQVEQDYVRGANQRQNAYMHGVGTVCGLKIAQHNNPDCLNQYVVLMPGLAIDCCGREIVVPEKRALDIRARAQEKLAGMGIDPSALATAEREAYTLRIVLNYRQKGAEPVPALLDDCDDGSGEECDQIVEDYDWDITLEREVRADADDPLEPSLEWRQTLTVGQPAAAVVDRDSERLYVAEMAADGGAVRVYNTETHDLLARAVVSIPTPVDGGADIPAASITALALSRNGERLYVALDPTGDLPGRVLLIDRVDLAAGALPDPATGLLPSIDLAADQYVVGLAAAVRDDALLALTVNADGQAATLRRWSADELADFLIDWAQNGPAAAQPAGVDRDLTDRLRKAKGDETLPEIAPVDMVQDIDGRWLVVSDTGGGGRLVALSLAGFNAAEASPQNFINAFGLGIGRVPRGVDLSYDGGYAYVIVSDGAASPATSLLRLKTDPTDLVAYLPQPLAGNDRIRELPLVWAEPNAPDAIDVAVTPRDNFAYILRRAAGPGLGGDVLIADVEQVERLGAGLIADRVLWLADPANQERLRAALRTGAVVQGAIDFETLAPLGQRLYVATHREPPAEEGEEAAPLFDGRLRVYDIDETSCDAGLRAIVEACATCGDSRSLVLATIHRYWYGQPMVEVEPSGDEPFNLIDNYSDRPLAPSNVVLREVIECLIAKGIAEGIPGPRGPQGEQGPQGETGPQGDPGVGLPGSRGPGFVDVRLEEGPPSAVPEPVGNPEGDLRLVLTLPLNGGAPPANHVSGANFTHEEIFNLDRFIERFTNQADDNRLNGFLMAFEQEVRVGSLNNRTAYALIHERGQWGSPVAVLPLLALPVQFDPGVELIDVRILDGYRAVDTTADIVMPLVVDAGQLVFDPNQTANGVLLAPRVDDVDTLDGFYSGLVQMSSPEVMPLREMELDPEAEDLILHQVTIVLRGDQIVTPEGLYLDGNNMGRIAPEAAIFPSGNGTPGGDWVAVIHLESNNND